VTFDVLRLLVGRGSVLQPPRLAPLDETMRLITPAFPPNSGGREHTAPHELPKPDYPVFHTQSGNPAKITVTGYDYTVCQVAVDCCDHDGNLQHRPASFAATRPYSFADSAVYGRQMLPQSSAAGPAKLMSRFRLDSTPKNNASATATQIPNMAPFLICTHANIHTSTAVHEVAYNPSVKQTSHHSKSHTRALVSPGPTHTQSFKRQGLARGTSDSRNRIRASSRGSVSLLAASSGPN